MDLDRAHFEMMTDHDRELQREVADLFAAQAPVWAAALGDVSTWRSAVHTMKGSARGIGLVRLAQACEAAECAAAAALAERLADVNTALAEALAALEALAQEHAAA